MEIIDIRKMLKEKVIPICKLDENIMFMEPYRQDTPFIEMKSKSFFAYNINNRHMNKVEIGKVKSEDFFIHEQTVEGENAFYYITKTSQLFLNEFTIYKVNMENYASEEVFNFSEEKKYDNLMIERIDEKRFAVFLKENRELTFEEFENMDYGRDKYGYDKGVLFDTEKGESYEINDKLLLRGLKSVFFKTQIKGEKVIVYEESYLEPFQKEPIYMDIQLHRMSKKDKFYYHDCLKYIPVSKFFEEVKGGIDKLSFIDIEGCGIEGYALFIGADENNLYYESEIYGQENGHNIVFLNRSTMSKKTIYLKPPYEDSIMPPSYIPLMEGRDKYIFSSSLRSEEEAVVEEILRGKINYTYNIKHGIIKGCIEERYLVLSRGDDRGSTTIIDTQTGEIASYSRGQRVFNDLLILF